MAITLVNLTGDVANLVGADFDPNAKTTVWIEANVDHIADLANNKIRMGTALQVTAADGTFTFTGLVATGSADTNLANSADLQYRVWVNYRSLTARKRIDKSFGWYAIGATSDITDLVQAQQLEPTWQSNLDAATAGNVTSTTSQTRAALSDAIDVRAMPHWTIGTTPGSVPTIKPAADARAGVWEFTHNDTTGYLFHLLCGAGMNHENNALIGMGIDNNGVGLLVSNKKTGRGIYVTNNATITGADAYGFHGNQLSTTAPLMRLEQQAVGGADVLQLVAFSGKTGRLLYVGDASGEAGTIDAATGVMTWKRTIYIRDSSIGAGSPSYLRLDTHTGIPETGRKQTYLLNNGMVIFGSIGSATQYAPYGITASGSSAAIACAPFFTPADHTTPGIAEPTGWVDVFKWRYSGGAAQIGFFGVTQVARPAAYTQTYATASRTQAALTSTDAAGATPTKAEFDALRADLINVKQVLNSITDDFQAFGLLQ